MAHIQDQKFTELGLRKVVSAGKITSYHRDLDKASDGNPILVLLHGYPQSAYIWRLLVPLLPGKPLFIPDLPGYGSSAPTDRHDKVNIGLRVIEALHEVFSHGDKKLIDSPPIVLIGHDRGARVAHALHVSTGQAAVLGFQIIGVALLDIVPTLSQWEIGDTAAAQTGYFHWSFLANVTIAKPMILAYGGGKWANNMITRWAGSNEEGLDKLRSGDSLSVYGSFFDQESVIEASCRDYEAGATTDLDFERKAIETNQRIVVPLLLVYSQGFLPKRARKPITEVWSQPWSDGPSLITACPLGNGIGHFIPEEAPELTAEALLKWLPLL
ncbi:alpha/beta-hydrolase [Cucurbitaria berberidis CBS 394.84]|uniref:Alpha/beta-hydrolase n=1 Tax=Cucurbitaria berberidis CBS 394.84 TaxID=1168544 RepID=A0A9P4LA58_9PLEO|nr:alpha/beta-hydrolase [Cucurbitaria berberidis CBS 394.84]KAF1847088.1 alpha/beta-hydrolase [Cucurbitaria berberidis CBS 394.84]